MNNKTKLKKINRRSNSNKLQVIKKESKLIIFSSSGNAISRITLGKVFVNLKNKEKNFDQACVERFSTYFSLAILSPVLLSVNLEL